MNIALDKALKTAKDLDAELKVMSAAIHLLDETDVDRRQSAPETPGLAKTRAKARKQYFRARHRIEVLSRRLDRMHERIVSRYNQPLTRYSSHRGRPFGSKSQAA